MAELSGGNNGAAALAIGATILSKDSPGATFKKANGQTLSQALYPGLFALIGITPRFTPTLKTVIPSSLIDVAYSASLGLYVGIASSNPGIYTSTDLVQWNAANTAGIGATPTSIAYCSGLGMFVICAGSASVYTSTDGLNWTRQNVYPDTTLSFVACSPSLIVVGGASDLDNSILNVWSSADGVTWTKRALAGTAAITITALHYSAGMTLFMLGGSTGAIQTSPDGVTWTSRTSNVSSQIRAFDSFASLAVVVAASGQISSSPDGTTWASRTYQTVHDLNGVAYSSTATIPWIACGASIIMTSTDGLTWVTLEDNYTGTSSILWDGSKYVSVGSAGSIQTSADLISWTGRISSQLGSNHFNSVAFGAAVYVMAGNGGKINSSADGITWTTRVSGVATALNHVIFVAGAINLFIAVGASSVVLTSVDGVTWAPATAAGGTFTSVAFNGTIIVAVSTTGLIFSSTNGILFTSRTSNTGRSINGVSWNGTIFCAVGANGTSLTSTDGITWTKQTPTGLPNSSLAWVTSDAAKFYACVSGTGIVYQSTDAIAWQGYACPIDLLSLNFINSLLVAYSANGDIATSSNGTVWSLPANSRGVVAAFNKCFWFSAATKFLVTGSAMGGYLSSTNGIIYRGFNGSAVAGGWLAYSENDNKLVIVGSTGLSILTSVDGGVTWVPNYSLTNSGASVFFVDVCYCSSLDLFVAVGANGFIATSPDGSTWTQRVVLIAGAGTMPSLQFFNSVVWSEEKTLFVAVGSMGIIATSPDGSTWTQRTSGTNLNIAQVCYNESLNLFVAVGSAGLVLTSTNGTAWTVRPTGFPVVFSAVSSLESLGFVATGQQAQTYTSADGISWQLSTGFGTASFPAKSLYSSVDECVFVPVGIAANGSSGFLYSTNDGTTQVQHGLNMSGSNAPLLNGFTYNSADDSYVVIGIGGTPSSIWVCILGRSYDLDTEFALPVLRDTWIKAL